MEIKADFSELKKYALKLAEIGKSALPVAVRTALNSTAFDVKKSTLQSSADRNFVKRSPNFFKANSRVNLAQGFDINTMQSEIGMMESGLKGESNYSVKDLEQQQFGGTINKKSFIPMTTARGAKNALVRPKNRLSAINKVIDARKAKAATDGQKFVKSALFAGVGGYVLARYKEKMILWRVNSIRRTSGGAFKLTPLYSFKAARTVSVSGTNFMGEAADDSHKKLPDFFVAEAEKRINKIARK